MRKRLITYGAAGGLIILTWLFFGFTHQRQELNSLRSQTSEARQRLTDFETTLTGLPDFITTQNRQRMMQDNIDSKLYTKRDLLTLFEELRSEASGFGLEIIDITPPVEELLELNRLIPDSTTPQFLNVRLRIEGGYVGFGRFVEVVEKAGFFRGVNFCSITGDRQLPEKLWMTFGFKALVGRYRESA